MITKTCLFKKLESKKPWEVKSSPSQGDTKLSPDSQLAKLISLRHFECPVAHNIQAALATVAIDEELVPFYLEFIKDEDKHDRQLEQLALHYGVAEVKPPSEIMEAYEKLKFEEHPLLVNFVLEQLFIISLPQIQRQGDVFANYCASWVLLDEAMHILIGRYMLSQMELKIEERHIDFAMKVIDWLGLDNKAKKTLLHNVVFGTASNDIFEQQVVVSPRISFFEHQEVSYGN